MVEQVGKPVLEIGQFLLKGAKRKTKTPEVDKDQQLVI